SSGETTLAKEIAQKSNGVFVPEYAREYLAKLGREYVEEDLLLIAKGQYKLQEEAKKNIDKKICFDTDLLTIKIWSEVKYGRCDEWILDRLYSNPNAFYILCKPDFPWEYDELRENPTDRGELFNLYQKELESLNLPYQISSGTLLSRVEELIEKRSL
ncbi:MAG: AAA family ATPase, partial [Flavobacteriales bacterium]